MKLLHDSGPQCGGGVGGVGGRRSWVAVYTTGSMCLLLVQVAWKACGRRVEGLPHVECAECAECAERFLPGPLIPLTATEEEQDFASPGSLRSERAEPSGPGETCAARGLPLGHIVPGPGRGL